MCSLTFIAADQSQAENNLPYSLSLLSPCKALLEMLLAAALRNE